MNTKLTREQFVASVKGYLKQHCKDLDDAGFPEPAMRIRTKIDFIRTLPQAMRVLTTMGDLDDSRVYILRSIIDDKITHNDATGDNEPTYDAHYVGFVS